MKPDTLTTIQLEKQFPGHTFAIDDVLVIDGEKTNIKLPSEEDQEAYWNFYTETEAWKFREHYSRQIYKELSKC